MKSHAGWLLENRIWQIIETISHGLWFPNRCGQIPALVGREPGQAASDGSWSAAYTTALCKGQLFTLDFPACVLCVWMIVGKVPMVMQAGVGLSTLGPPLFLLGSSQTWGLLKEQLEWMEAWGLAAFLVCKACLIPPCSLHHTSVVHRSWQQTLEKRGASASLNQCVFFFPLMFSTATMFNITCGG